MSTLQEIKAAAATLPADARNERMTWLSESKGVWEIRREQLHRDVEIGLAEIERGDVAPLDMAAMKRKTRERFDTAH